MVQRIFEAVGAFVLTHLANIGRVTLLYGETIRQVTRRLRVRSIIYQMAHLGADSLLIVGLTLLFTGVVLTLQIAHEFIRYGAQSTVGAVRSASGASSAPFSLALSVQGAWARRLQPRSRR